MSKVIVKLNRIPAAFATDLLKPTRIAKLELYHKLDANFLEETIKFVDDVMPGTKFNNQNFTFVRKLDDSSPIPIFKAYDSEGQLIETFDTASMNRNQILEKLKQLDKPKELTN